MDKPAFLYHGSCKGIKGALSPRPQHGDVNGNFPEGNRDLVFATHDVKLAAIYTLKTKHMVSAGNIGDQNFAFFRDYDEWKNEISHSACSVYELPSASFTNTISKFDGHPTVEWLSPEQVIPNRVIRYTPEMVMETGGQLFFLDAKVAGEMWHYEPNKSSHATFLNRLQAKRDAGILPPTFTPMHLARELMDAGIMRHLNADMGIKPIQLEKSPDGGLIKEDIEWLKEQMHSKSASEHTDKIWTKALGPRTGYSAAIAE